MYNYDDSRSELPVTFKLRAEAEGFDLIFHIVERVKNIKTFEKSPNVCRSCVYYKDCVLIYFAAQVNEKHFVGIMFSRAMMFSTYFPEQC